MTRPLHLQAYKQASCIDELKAWMIHNRLQLNDSETAVL